MTLLSETHMGLLASFGWSLLHFLWQGSVLAVALAAGLRIAQRDSANKRYVICCAVLACMVLGPVFTFASLKFGTGTPLVSTMEVLPHASPLVPSHGAQPSGSQPLFDGLILAANRDMRVIAALWAVGVLLCLGRLFLGFVGAARLKRRLQNGVPEGPQAAARRLFHRLGIARPVSLFTSSATTTPVVVGWLRPVIVFPTDLLSTLAPEQLEAVLAHELAHVRRHDYLVNILQVAVEALLFFHPGVWWVSKQIRREREHCCDDLAVQVSGSALLYAKALVTLEEGRSPAQPQLLLGASGGHLAMRITRLFKQRQAAAPVAKTRFALIALSVVTLVPLGVLSISATERVRAQAVAPSSNAPVVGSSAAAKNTRPDMSCYYYGPDQGRLTPRPGVCEGAPYGPFYCKQLEKPQPRQTQTACEWKVQRLRDWERTQTPHK